MDKDFWTIIEKTIHSKTVEDLSAALKDCLQILESKVVGKRNFIKFLNENLMSIGGAFRFEALLNNDIDKIQNVHIHDYEDAPVIYAFHRLVPVSKITEYKSRIRELIELFDNEFEVPKTIGLNKDQVSNVLKYLQSKYRVFDIITCKVELEIFLFNNSHKEFNSLCEVFYNTNQPEIYSNRDILLFASRSEEHDPYQVLIHEIGHALHVALTHEIMKIPESFIEMNKVLDVNLENNTIISADVFADVFSMVVMNKSSLAEHNWLISHFPSKVSDLFEYYFNKLLEHSLANMDVLKHKSIDIVWKI